MMNVSEEKRLAAAGLSPERIRALLAERGAKWELQVAYESESTNKDARAHYERRGGGSAIFIADGQTSGRGRRGRSFVSPHGTGIYMSLLLTGVGELGSLASVTAFTAVAVARAIERVCGLHADIKWVNDICYKGKKLGGILTEGALSEDMHTASYVIIGIGINVLRAELPEELADIASSIEEMTGVRADRGLLIAEIAAELERGIGDFASPEVVEEYRRRSCLVGREVSVHKLSGSYEARVIGIGDDMSLKLLLPDGSTENLITGEVSVRVK